MEERIAVVDVNGQAKHDATAGLQSDVAHASRSASATAHHSNSFPRHHGLGPPDSAGQRTTNMIGTLPPTKIFYGISLRIVSVEMLVIHTAA
jgi:hypothetical protein